MKTVNVVLHNFLPPYDSIIKNILQENNYKVNVTNNNFKITRDDCIDLLLCYFDSENERNQKLWNDLVRVKSNNKYPVVLIAQNTSFYYYQKLIETGLYHSISVPCGKSFLSGKIEDILSSGKEKSRLNDDKHIVFDAQFIKKQFAIENEELAHFLNVVVENLVHHNDIFHKQVVKSLCVFDNKEFGVIIDDVDVPEERQKDIEKELWQALENNEFELYYQPVYSLFDAKLTGFESLVRWNHPVKGVLRPDDFIPYMEQSEMIFHLGQWLFKQASKQARVWNSVYNFKDPIRININLSAKQFINQDLARQAIKLIKHNRVDPESIAFEITESAFMSDMEAANLILLELRANKCLIYLDDFGTGYSSLSYLMHFPVDVLKIDKSFVKWMHIDEQSLEIVKSVISLAHNLKMKVVAEGIEEAEHVHMLKGFNCDYGQGYYFDMPLKADVAEELIKKSV